MTPQASMTPPFVIPFFIPHAGCTHSCIFCNQTVITSQEANHPFSEAELVQQVETYLGYRRPEQGLVQLSFYGGNFLGLERGQLRLALESAAKLVDEGRVDSIRFSTRPDSIDREHLEMLADFPISTVELGAQSMDDRVLALARRGHTAADTERAIGGLAERGYEIGVQLMVGLPGDEERLSVRSAQAICRLSPAFVRIYPTVVLTGSILANWYRQGKYRPMSLEQAVTTVKKMVLLFRSARIPVIRMGLQASDELADERVVLAGPHHPAFGHMVHSEIFLDTLSAELSRTDAIGEVLRLKVHPRNLSELRGLRNRNIELLKQRFHLQGVYVHSDENLARNEIDVEVAVSGVDTATRKRLRIFTE